MLTNYTDLNETVGVDLFYKNMMTVEHPVYLKDIVGVYRYYGWVILLANNGQRYFAKATDIDFGVMQ